MKIIVPIDKNIPLPPRKRSTGRGKRVYPWGELEPGDSFVIPSLNANIRQWKLETTYPGKKFVSRRVEGGLRVWRIL